MYADGVATCDQGAVADRPGGGGKADTPAMPDGYGKAAGDGGCRGYGTAGKRRGQPEGGQGAGRYPAGAGGDSGKDVPEQKNNDTAVNEIRVIMSEEVEELSG